MLMTEAAGPIGLHCCELLSALITLLTCGSRPSPVPTGEGQPEANRRAGRGLYLHKSPKPCRILAM